MILATLLVVAALLIRWLGVRLAIATVILKVQNP
jgi:hypothetical protein